MVSCRHRLLCRFGDFAFLVAFMKKEYLQRLREIAQAHLIDDIGTQGVAFFDRAEQLGIHDDLAHILASAVAAEISGAGLYPSLKSYIDQCIQDDVETLVIDDARAVMRSERWIPS